MQYYYKRSRSIYIYAYAAMLMWCFAACTKNYEKYNRNPLLATDEDVAKDNLLTGSLLLSMQKSVIPVSDFSYQRGQNLLGDVYAGYMGVTKDWDASRNTTTYVFKQDWIVEPFNDAFLKVLPAWNLIRKSAKTTPDGRALANIIKVACLHRTTDIYGPLPYLSFGSNTITANAYDAQESIYQSFFNDLDSSIAALTAYRAQDSSSSPMLAYDLVYGGSYLKWIKFANTLKLRLAMRIVYADPVKAKKYAEAAVANPYGVLTTPVEDDALLKSISSVDIANPLDIICNTYNDIRMGAFMEAVLKGYKDPRMAAWFMQSKARPTDAEAGYYGIRNGLLIDDANKYKSFSKLRVTSRTPMLWMPVAEAYFLRAEGALRGWNMNGTAKELYEAGIKASFQQNQVGGVGDYIADNKSIPAEYSDPLDDANTVSNSAYLKKPVTIAWNNSDDFELKLEKIITQKWIALYPNGQEAWTEFRRTGYPRIFPVVYNFSSTVSTTRQVRRIPFPNTEYKNNPKGVATGVALLGGGGDIGSTQLWWDKKNK
ncbi:MAG: SusD/RagB family nutrient-binding outer membrane lipoprotein [Niabella sp.]|nr:SusD/RagB family nutrient-binding outer membrane lipoprotein [Niabella sp.]